MSQTPLDEWRIGDKGMIVVLRTPQQLLLNGRHCTVKDICDGCLEVVIDSSEAPSTEGIKLPPVCVVPFFPRTQRVQENHDFKDPADFFEVVEEGEKGRGVRAKRAVAKSTLFGKWPGITTQQVRLDPSSEGRRFLPICYPGKSTPDNSAIVPKKTQKMLDALYKALHEHEGVIRAGVLDDSDYGMVCWDEARHCGELCNNGGCPLCGMGSYTAAALSTCKVSMLLDAEPVPDTALRSNWETCKKRAQLAEYIMICDFVQTGFSLIVFDGCGGDETLELRHGEFQARRVAWVETVWHTVFVWLSNAFLERPLVEDVFKVENFMQVNMDKCRQHSLGILQQEIERLHHADVQRPRSRDMHAKLRKSVHARISAIAAEIRPSQAERDFQARSLHIDPHISHVILHDAWVSLTNGAKSEADKVNINVQIFKYMVPPPGTQREMRIPQDFAYGFSALKDIEEDEFLCMAYNDEASIAKGYFADCENSIKEQAYVIPAVNAVLKRFLAHYKSNMPDYVWDYLSLCSELASHDEPVPRRDSPAYEPK